MSHDQAPPLDPAELPDQHPTGRATPVRYLVLVALASLAASAYLTRNWIAAANTTIQRETGFTPDQMGYLLAAFNFGYLWFQIPGGWLGSRYGARIVLSTISVLWSLCTFWTGQAFSFIGLWSSRVACGLGQAGMVPCSAKVLIDWLPDTRRGIASAIIGSSMSVGGVVASGLTANLLPVLGWRGVVVLYAPVGVAWSLVFYLWFRNQPREHTWTNQAEQDLIRFGQPHQRQTVHGIEEPASEEVPLLPAVPPGRSDEPVWLAMLSSASMWMICAQAFFRAFGYEFFVTWFPAYLEKGHGVNVTEAGELTMQPLAGVVVGSLLGGVLVDAVLSWTGKRWLSRCGTAATALGLCSLCSLTASRVQDPQYMVVVISVGSFLLGLSGPGSWAAAMDVAGKHTPIIFGVLNMTGIAGALACPIVVGYLIAYIERSAGDWNLVLYLFAVIYISGAACFWALDPNRPVVEPKPSHASP